MKLDLRFFFCTNETSRPVRGIVKQHGGVRPPGSEVCYWNKTQGDIPGKEHAMIAKRGKHRKGGRKAKR